MTDLDTIKKWDRAAPWFDLMAGSGAEKRWCPAKRALFSHMQGKILFVAAGTGLDFVAFPPRQNLTAIDISSEMLKRAKIKARDYDGGIELLQMDINELAFADNSFDQVYTSCTFCSVPRPIDGLRQLSRVLKPGGEILMFEHTGSRYFPFKQMLDLMNPLAKHTGPELNRDTVANVAQAGFRLLSVNHIFLDVVKTIRAEKPAS